ncbi:MAG: hypothetical protein BAJALOKI2v1_40080 [Promethearchaeota archaeon]|nr:MAG: hypothetical protein BAJALOKI2v1_40080 [Candidatus Lokiarchaeota archaeon]
MNYYYRTLNKYRIKTSNPITKRKENNNIRSKRRILILDTSIISKAANKKRSPIEIRLKGVYNPTRNKYMLGNCINKKKRIVAVKPIERIDIPMRRYF